MPELYMLIIAVGSVLIVLLTIYLVTALCKRHSLSQLYADSARDFRFVCELLRRFTDKKCIIKNPCLLRSYGTVSPRADALIVGGGGVLILTVLDEAGQYSAPVSGSWTVWQNGEMKKIPNAFLPGRQYTSVITSLLVKCGISCPVVNLVVLTDDHATVDSLHGEFVLTCKDLVPYVKGFCRSHALGTSGQEKLKKAIRQHHELCQKQLANAMVGEIHTEPGSLDGLPTDEETASLPNAAMPELRHADFNDSIWDALVDVEANSEEDLRTAPLTDEPSEPSDDEDGGSEQ